MLETERLYDRDAYLTGCGAEVLAVRKADPSAAQGADREPEAAWEVILNRTVFFPEGGGQSSDTGWIIAAGTAPSAGAAYRVTEVQITDGVIVHTVTKGRAAQENAAGAYEPVTDSLIEAVSGRCRQALSGIEDSGRNGQELPGIAPGSIVTLRIDWERRFSFMQNHTGEHILSGLMHGRYGFDNIGFHLSDNSVTLDVNGQLGGDEILQLEREANEVIYKNAEVEVLYPSEKELTQYIYRSKIEIEGQVRLVKIPCVDLCACCAPHVKRTGEIGLIKIVRTINFNGGMRLFILCGRRALELIEKNQQCVEEVSHLTNRSRDEIGDGVKHLLDEIGSLKQKNRELEYRAASLYLASIPGEQENVFLFVGDMDTIVQRTLVNRLCEEHSGFCGVFCGDDGTGYRYIIGSRTRDAGEAQKKLREKLGAKGGGKPAMVQGSVTGIKESIEEALA